MNTRSLFLAAHISRASQILQTLLITLTLLVAGAWTSAQAQSVTDAINPSDAESDITLDSPASSEQVRDVVSRMSDQQVRALLLERLDAVAESASKTESSGDTRSSELITFIASWGTGVGNSIKDAIVSLPYSYSNQSQSVAAFISPRGATGSFHFIGVFLLSLFAGAIIEALLRYSTRRLVEEIKLSTKAMPFRKTLKLLSLRLFLDLSALLAFFIAAAFVLATLLSPLDKQLCNLIMLNIVILPRLVRCLTRFLLAPKHVDLRLVNTDDWTARYLHRHVLGLFLLMGISSTVAQFNVINGIGPGTVGLGFWFNMSLHIYVIYIALSAKDGLRTMLIGRGDDATPSETRFTYFYPYFLVTLTIVVWLIVELIAHLGAFHLLRNEPQITTLLIFLFIPALDTLIRVLVANLAAPMRGEGRIATRAYDSTKLSYTRIGRALVFGGIVLLLMDIWHINLNTMASDAVGATIAADLIKLAIILSIGYLVWEVVSLFFNRRLAAEDTAAGQTKDNEESFGGEGGGAGSSRLATILPLVRFTTQTIVLVMTILIALSNVGINATPLLAGAGVVGIAVGFGAQKLVSDVVSGIFFLIDDAFRAGEYVSIDDTVGTVEKISLRSMQLRHHRGAVHTIPYGEIPKLTNYSRDWVLMKLRFTVPFDTDLKKVKRIFKTIGSEVIDLPQFSDDLLQPFKSQGVLEVNDVGIVIGGKFMAKPGTQFMMRKELFLRVQKAFDENGIQFARKEVKVRLDGDAAHKLDEKQLTTIAAAAAEISEQNDEGDAENH